MGACAMLRKCALWACARSSAQRLQIRTSGNYYDCFDISTVIGRSHTVVH